MNDQAMQVLEPVARRFGSSHDLPAPRPSSLDGLTVGLLWNGKPNGDVGLHTAGERIASQYPSAAVKFYPGRIACESTLLDQIVDECDVVVACTADCGSCTSWIAHDCIQLERGGVPCVIIASAGFEDNIEASAQAFGLSGLQYVVVPQVFNNITEREAREQTEPVVGEVIRYLTAGDADTPVAATPSEVDDVAASHVYTAGADGLARFNDDYLARDWGDGYPLLPPTPAAVERLIGALDMQPDDHICILPPGSGYATARNVAINAAMAGCEPDEMPVVAAAVRSIANLRMPMGRMGLMSTSAQAPLFLVNGPIAERLGINGGRCCLGPGRQNRVNIRIGRAVLLAMKNIGRWYPGIMDMDTLGSARKFNQVVAENEAESPWEPYHVSAGYEADQDVVSLFITSGDLDVAFQGHVDEQQLARALAAKFGGVIQSTYIHRFMVDETEDGRLILMAPQHARPLSQGGFSKQDFIEFLHTNVKEPVARMIEPLWKLRNDGKIKDEYDHLFEMSPEEAAMTMIPALDREELWNIAIAGSVRAKGLVMPLMCLPVSEPV